MASISTRESDFRVRVTDILAFAMKEIHFVNSQKPGQKSNASEADKIRQHVRRAVLRDRGHRNIKNRVRHFTGTTFIIAPVSSARSVAGSPETVSAHTKDAARKKRITESYKVDFDGGGEDMSQFSRSISAIRPWTPHPFTAYAACKVPLPVERVDSLFKSRLFRNAAEPLFDTSHVDSCFSMVGVFPGSLQCLAFLNALLYSVLQMANKGKPSLDGLRLLGRALQSISRSTSSQNQLSPAEIGAIMILQGVSYRWPDHSSFEAHTKGLMHCLQSSTSSETRLTPLAATAMFWQDLFAALLIDSERHHACFAPPPVQWQRIIRPCPASALPSGFLGLEKVLPSELLDCVQDILEMQTTLCDMKSSVVSTDILGCMQASIETRLTSRASLCRALGPIAECCRLAILIVCYLSWTDIWANPFVPCRLSDMLRARLYDSITSLDWQGRYELQLWLVYTGSMVVLLDEGHVDSLRQDWNGVSNAIISLHPGSSRDIFPGPSLESVLSDFIYCDELLQQRHCVEAWSKLETNLHWRNLDASEGS